MSYSLKVSDGDIDIGSATGRFNTVRGYEKLSQDVGEVLLIKYDPSIDYGNELIDFDLIPSSPISTGNINRMVNDAISRFQALQQHQSNLSYDEKMSHIGQLIVVPNNKGDVYFYVSVVAADGESIEKMISAGKAIPVTKLNQSLPPALAGSIKWK